jgi:hypothetical protein
MTSRFQQGLVAGLAATVVTSLLEVPNMFLNWFDPFPNVIARTLGLENVMFGWAIHLLAGTLILGPLFAWLYPRLPTDTPETKGIVFSVGAFVLMLVGIMVMGGAGDITGATGFGTVAWLLITHVVFGLVLGNVFGRMLEKERREARAAQQDAVAAH